METLHNSKNKTHRQDEIVGKSSSKNRWLNRLGFGTFLFFLIKGLIWVGVAIAALIGIKGS